MGNSRIIASFSHFGIYESNPYLVSKYLRRRIIKDLRQHEHVFINVDSLACAADKAVRDVYRFVIRKGFIDINRCQIGRIVIPRRLVREVDACDRFAMMLSSADEARDGVIGVISQWSGG